jgi:hypothetical protein
MGEHSIRYHLKEGHLSKLMALARDAERAARADSLLDRIEALQSRTEAALVRAEQGDNPAHVFRGISEMRANLELIGEVTRELNRTPTLNFCLSAEWLELRTLIVNALELHPEARDAVVAALESAES